MTRPAFSRAVLSIGLTLPKGAADYCIDQIDLMGDGMRHLVTSESTDKSLSAVFSSNFLAFLRDLLQRLSAATMVFTDTDLGFSGKELVLRNVQMMSTIRPDGNKRIVVRFLEVIGNVQSLLVAKHTPTSAETNAIAVEALENVVGRTYDVARVAEALRASAMTSPAAAGCGQEILDRRQELLFRLDLLQRAVSGDGRASDTLIEQSLIA